MTIKTIAMKHFFLILICFTISQTLNAQTYQANWESIDSRPVPTWFEDAKFGIFIHWGVYSVPAYSPTARDSVVWWNRYSEWYWNRLIEKNDVQHFFQTYHNKHYGEKTTYQDLARDFKAELFNPDIWAEKIKFSGAKYVVLTAKHHDGFTLWNSQFSPSWNSVAVGSHQDLVGAVTNSVRKKGIRMGLYYSLKEWYNPNFNPQNINQYVDDHMVPQMKELIKSYEPDVLWTDGDGDFSSEKLKSTQFLAWLFNESSIKNKVAVNDRWGTDTGGKHGGFHTTEYDNLVSEDLLNDKQIRPWEECRGMAGSFGYNRNENLEDYSTSTELIHILIKKVAQGGNLLLNIGPTADGRIPEIMQQRLFDIGQWLTVNGESIYGTRKWNNAPKMTKDNSIFFTKKGNDLFVIVTQWQDKLSLENINKNAKISLLGYKGQIKSEIKDGKTIITAPIITPNTIPCQHAWVYKIENGAL
jgi:alpha-L-fucosidase